MRFCFNFGAEIFKETRISANYTNYTNFSAIAAGMKKARRAVMPEGLTAPGALLGGKEDYFFDLMPESMTIWPTFSALLRA